MVNQQKTIHKLNILNDSAPLKQLNENYALLKTSENHSTKLKKLQTPFNKTFKLFVLKKKKKTYLK